MTMRILLISTISALALSIGCSSDGEKKDDASTMKSHVSIDGDHIVIDEHINFATDSDEILESSNGLMDEMSKLMIANVDTIKYVKIIGHTDSTGDDTHNKELSERRAASVKMALKERAVGQKMIAWGMGEEAPLCSDDTPECHEMNRRVEFIILQEDDPSVLELMKEGTEKAAGSAGDAVGDAAEATGDAVGDAVEATGDAVEATGDAVGEATDND